MFTKTKGFLGVFVKLASRALSNQALITTKSLHSHTLYSASPSLFVKRRANRRAFPFSQIQPLGSKLYTTATTNGSGQIEDFSSLRRRLFVSTVDNMVNVPISEPITEDNPTDIQPTHYTQNTTDQSIDNIFPFLTGEELKVFDPSIYQ